MRRKTRWRRGLMWAATVLTLLIVVAFVYSTRRAVTWKSPGVRYQASLMRGALAWAWRPDGWLREADPYAGNPGFSVSEYAGAGTGTSWWIEFYNGKKLRGVSIPLWIALVPLSTTALILQFRERAATAAAVRGALARLRPRRLKRVRVAVVVLAAVIHAAAVWLTTVAVLGIYRFLSPPNALSPFRTTFEDYVYFAFAFLTLTTPVFGYVWTRIYVDFCNRWLRRGPMSYCLECGYDLTGNLSGGCPECGNPTQAGITGTSAKK